MQWCGLAMNRKQRDALRRRARATGPVIHTARTCLACGAEGEAYYREAPLLLRCDLCGKRAVVRDDDEPYPPPAEPLPM